MKWFNEIFRKCRCEREYSSDRMYMRCPKCGIHYVWTVFNDGGNGVVSAGWHTIEWKANMNVGGWIKGGECDTPYNYEGMERKEIGK